MHEVGVMYLVVTTVRHNGKHKWKERDVCHGLDEVHALIDKNELRPVSGWTREYTIKRV